MSIVPGRTTPLGLGRFADEFLVAALAADERLGPSGEEGVAYAPVMYLLGHSIELSLKAFLAHHGVPLEDLKSPRKFGHDLGRCLEKAEELGLGAIAELDDLDVSAIATLNVLYSAKELNYITTGPRNYPTFGPVRSVATRLLLAVAPAVGLPSHRLLTRA